MPRHYCCANTCKSTNFKGTEANVRFIKFPQDSELRDRWREVIGRGPEFSISQNTRICSKHFKSGKRSLNPASEDYVPSVFEEDSEYKKKNYCRTCRKLRCRCGLRARTLGLEKSSNGEEAEPEGEPEEEQVEVEMADRTAAARRRREAEDDDESEPDDGELEDDNDQDWSPVVAKKEKYSSSSSANSTPTYARTKGRVSASPASSSKSKAALTPAGPASASRGPAADAKTLKKIKELEEEHSRKLETMARNHNMTVANLKEEFQQKIHAMKLEWEDEKTKLWNQIEFLKDALNQSYASNPR